MNYEYENSVDYSAARRVGLDSEIKLQMDTYMARILQLEYTVI